MLAYFILLLIIGFDFLLEYVLKRFKFINVDKEDKDFGDKLILWFFKYRVITIISLAFFSMFRDLSVGLDTISYYNYYRGLVTGELQLFKDSIGTRFEFGFTFIVSLIAVIGLDFRFVSIIVALFVTICLVVFINKVSPNKLMSFVLYIALGVFAQSISTMRQIIAMAILLMALLLLINKKWIWSSVLILCASIFHVSVIVCLIIVPLRYIKVQWYVPVVSLCLTVIGSVCLPFVLKIVEKLTPLDYYTKYFVDFRGFIQSTNLVNILYSLALVAIFVVMWAAKIKILKFNEKQSRMFDLFLLMYMFVPLIRIAGLIVSMQALFNRVSMYFFLSLIVLIPLFVEGLRHNRRYYIACNILVYIVAFGYMYYIYAIELTCGVVPYIIKL